MTPTALYRHYDAEDRLLYVGITARPSRRMYEHKCRTDWAGQIKQTIIDWFEDREAALQAERDTIRLEDPLYNITGSGERVTSVPTDTIAGKVIMKCGGVDAVARITDRTESAVYRWTYPTSKGGTGGRIPPAAQHALLEAASRGEVEITPSDFFPRMTGAAS